MSPNDAALKVLNSLPSLDPDSPLADKLDRTRAVLAAVARAATPEQTAVAYTGGKDSGVALSLWSVALSGLGRGPLRAISIDTGLKFPEVTAFRDSQCDELGVELTLARPQVDLSTYPVAKDKLACCRDLKIKPLHEALRGTGTELLITGLRRDEHPSRADRPYAELRPGLKNCDGSCGEHWQINPILDWTEIDIWAFITGQGLPYCELYHQGYRSLGCMPCTSPCEGCALGADLDSRLGGGAERAGRDQDKERQLETLQSLGYF